MSEIDDNEKEPDFSQTERILLMLGDMERRQVLMEETLERKIQALGHYLDERVTAVEKKSSPENKTSQDVRKLDATNLHYAGVAAPEEKLALEQSVQTPTASFRVKEEQRIDTDFQRTQVERPRPRSYGGDRRDSNFVRNIEQTFNSVEEPRKSQVIPACKLMLNSLDPAEILKWLREWKDFQLVHKVRIAPNTIVSEKVLFRLEAEADKNVCGIYDMSPKQFTERIALEIKTQSKADHYHQVEKALRHILPVRWSKKGYEVNPSNHTEFYDAMLRLKKVVLETHEFFRHANSANTPKVSGPCGAAKWFTSRVDWDYHDSVKATMEDPKTFSELSDYLDAYMVVVREHYDNSQKYRAVPYRGAGFLTAKTAWSRDGDDSDDERPRYAKYPKKTTFPSRSKSSLNKLDTKSVHFGYDSDAAVSEYSDGPDICQQRDAPTWDDVESGTEADDQVLEPRESGPWLDQYPDWNTKHLDSDVLNALDVERTAKQFDKDDQFEGCIYYTIFGKCNRGKDCKHAGGHSPVVSKKTSAWILRKIAENDGSSGEQPRRILTRDRR